MRRAADGAPHPRSTLPRRTPDIVVLVLAVIALTPRDAAAYLDPGSGSLLIQGLVATLAAAGYALRMYWGRIRGWVARRGETADGPDPRPPATSR